MLIQTVYKQKVLPAGPENSPPYQIWYWNTLHCNTSFCIWSALLYWFSLSQNKIQLISYGHLILFFLQILPILPSVLTYIISCKHAATAAELMQMPVFQVCCLCFWAGFGRTVVVFGRAAAEPEHQGALMQPAYTPYVTSIYCDSQTISRIHLTIRQLFLSNSLPIRLLRRYFKKLLTQSSSPASPQSPQITDTDGIMRDTSTSRWGLLVFLTFSHTSPASKPNFRKIALRTHYSHCFTATETPVFTNVSCHSSIIKSLAECMANISWGHSLRRKGKEICCVGLIYFTRKLKLLRKSCEKPILINSVIFLGWSQCKNKQGILLLRKLVLFIFSRIVTQYIIFSFQLC